MEIKYSIITKEEEKEVISFLDKVLNHRLNQKIWDWEFANNAEEAVFTLAKNDSEIVGTQAFLPIKLNHNGTKILTSKSETSHLNPNYRGKKIFESLYLYGLDKCKEVKHTLVWGYTSAVKVWKNTLQFEVVEPCMYDMNINLHLIVDKDLLKKYSLNYFIYQAKYFYHALKVNSKRKERNKFFEKNTNSKLTQHPKPIAASDLENFYTEIRSKYNIHFHLNMDEEYMNWRIYNNPTLNYKTVFFYNNKKLTGYYVYTIRENRLMLSDFSFVNEEVANTMLKQLVTEMESNKINDCYYFGNYNNQLNKYTFDVLEKLGGIKSLSGWASFVLKNNLSYPEFNLYDTSLWYMNGLWTEGFGI